MDTYTLAFDESTDSAEEIIQILRRRGAYRVEDYGEDWIEMQLTEMEVEDVERLLTEEVIWFEWW